MKTITIGDLHGKDVWKIIKPELWDKIIFIGDYVDSWEISNVLMKKNLEDIIAFKKQFMDKIILLRGNHDNQYDFLGDDRCICSGFRPEIRYDFHELFKNNNDLFQAAYQVNNYLWTHAGVHKGWYEYRFKKWINDFKAVDNLSLSEQLNEAFQMEVDCLFDVGHRRGGYHDVGGIFWSDKQETYQNPLPNYHQIIGHTKVPGISHYDINDTTSVTYVDCLEFTDIPEFYELEIKEQNDII